MNHPDDYRFGTVGMVMPGSEVKIAADGEILIKGPGVMDGYHNLPEQTAETLSDGWLHTGDIGELDADGFLKITDRKKDLFKTSGGKYIAPTAIESQFKAICPYASQFLVHGNERNYCVALVTLDPDAMADWANDHGMGEKSYAEVVSSPEVTAMVDGYVAELNERLNRWETIKKYHRARPRPHRRVRRADAVDEGQAQGRRGQLPQRDRQALRLTRSRPGRGRRGFVVAGDVVRAGERHGGVVGR